MDKIEPTKAYAWPAKVFEMLHTFRAEGTLQGSSNYRQFIGG